ncbi:MAG: hypothetical protein ABIT01_04100, partial [Thermoanaerobaculia bacterium]
MKRNARLPRLLATLLVAGGLSSGVVAQELPLPTVTPTPRHSPRKSLGGGITEPRRTSGDSLADTVRTSQDSQGGGKKKSSLGTITNESLKKAEIGPGKKGHVILAPKVPVAQAQQAPASDVRDSSGRSESDWRAAAAAARMRTTSAEAEVKRLEDEAKRLENEFYAWSDGNYRD